VRVVLSKRVSVGCGRQVSWLMDKLANNKWPTGHLECEMDEVTMTEAYRWGGPESNTGHRSRH
jgi:hypothetical protein